ncbi:MAG TPA: ABC transporter permease [Thermomicrobiales bacterium]|nr:ABC transporter permease [Thermomicrobiales bacterium]
MAGYIFRRILWMIPVLWLVATVTFILMHLAPGSPWDARSGAQGRDLDASLEASFNRQYGLDKPLIVQYFTYLKNAVTFDFGESFVKVNKSVVDVIGDGFPYSATIGVLALAIALGIGIPVGVLAASRHNTMVDYVSLFVTTISYTLPDFVIGIFLLIIFAVQFGWFPVLFTDWRSYILPALALGTGSAAYIARLTRSSVLEASRMEHVTTARAKGLRSRSVMARHIVRNGMIPVITIIGPALAGLITGTIIIESVFAVPGMGRLFIDAINSRDYPVIMGITLFYAFLITLGNLLVDIMYGLADPRIRESQ